MAHRPDYESADYKEGYEDGKREASKEWVGLSDVEIYETVGDGVWDIALAIQAKLREKNEK